MARDLKAIIEEMGIFLSHISWRIEIVKIHVPCSRRGNDDGRDDSNGLEGRNCGEYSGKGKINLGNDKFG